MLFTLTTSHTHTPALQVFWALSKLRYSPTPCELEGLLGATARVLPSATPVLLATILWGLADMQVRDNLPGSAGICPDLSATGQCNWALSYTDLGVQRGEFGTRWCPYC